MSLDLPESKTFTSKNRIYKRYKKDGQIRTRVYDRETNAELRDISFAQARNEMKFIQMNGVINRLMTKHGLGLHDARDLYFMKKAEIREGRIRNIMTLEGMNRASAEKFYNGLVVSGSFGKLKAYS
jgi:hypothetical protein